MVKEVVVVVVVAAVQLAKEIGVQEEACTTQQHRYLSVKCFQLLHLYIYTMLSLDCYGVMMCINAKSDS